MENSNNSAKLEINKSPGTSLFIMGTGLRKFMLTAHVTFSVGWFGAVVVFLVLAITGLTSDNIQLSRASLIAMELSAWFVILPFCFLSLFTGVIQAIGTKWGLLKHYWIVVKLFLTVASSLLLLLHMKPISDLAFAASNDTFSNTQHSQQIINLISKTGAAILALLVITTISIYKPWGKILYRNQNNQKHNPAMKKKSPSFYILMVLLIIIAIVIVKHLSGGGMRLH